jgi:hypothetical protein
LKNANAQILINWALNLVEPSAAPLLWRPWTNFAFLLSDATICYGARDLPVLLRGGRSWMFSIYFLLMLLHRLVPAACLNVRSLLMIWTVNIVLDNPTVRFQLDPGDDRDDYQ